MRLSIYGEGSRDPFSPCSRIWSINSSVTFIVLLKYEDKFRYNFGIRGIRKQETGGREQGAWSKGQKGGKGERGIEQRAECSREYGGKEPKGRRGERTEGRGQRI